MIVRYLPPAALAALLGSLTPYLGGALWFAGFGEPGLFSWWFNLLPTLALMLVDPSPTWALYVISMVYAMQYAVMVLAVRMLVLKVTAWRRRPVVRSEDAARPA